MLFTGTAKLLSPEMDVSIYHSHAARSRYLSRLHSREGEGKHCQTCGTPALSTESRATPLSPAVECAIRIRPLCSQRVFDRKRGSEGYDSRRASCPVAGGCAGRGRRHTRPVAERNALSSRRQGKSLRIGRRLLGLVLEVQLLRQAVSGNRELAQSPMAMPHVRPHGQRAAMVLICAPEGGQETVPATAVPCGSRGSDSGSCSDD